jgi:histidyl-tRNA synthetase
MIVRGLDYYNRTVFEIKSNNLGSQNAVCGGGRYDSLVKTLGGEDTPAVGWALGMERLNSLIAPVEPQKLDAYIVSNSTTDAFGLAQELRGAGFSVEFDLSNKKFTKQLEKAAKTAEFALILGEDEVENNTVSVKNLSTAEQITVKRSEICTILLNK